jgi:hypothetical protein
MIKPPVSHKAKYVFLLSSKYLHPFLFSEDDQSKTLLQATGYQTCSAAEQRGI